MKNIFLPLFCLVTIQLQAQPDLNDLEDFQAGKCYFSYPLDSSHLDTLYIEIVPLVFESYKERLDKIDIPEVSVDEGKLKVEVQPKSLKYLKRKVPRACLPSKFPLDKLISFCAVEVPARYETIESVCIVKDGKKLLAPSRQDIFIERKRVVQKATLRVISREEVANSENDVYPVVKGK